MTAIPSKSLAVAVMLAAWTLAADLHVYVGDTGPRHVLIAWGTAKGSGNRIGRDSLSHGQARLVVGDKAVETTRAWAQVEGLAPDQSYDYSLSLDGRVVFNGRVRTWPEQASNCTFLVIGDFGNGSGAQKEVAHAMARLVRERAASARPVRFVVTTGDNIYSLIPGVWLAGSGDRDADWIPRFFEPYREVIATIPFYPSLGNHDGNESEKRKDLDVYLDNFFLPGNRPARWYSFNYGGLIDFFALDTTRNTLQGPKAPLWLAGGEQHLWAGQALRASRAPWKVAYMHHPIFNAGPRHDAERNFERMGHLLKLFGETGVQAVFQGHEHNLQVSLVNQRSLGVRFFISGAGGELRDEDISQAMDGQNIEAWAPSRHFLLVDVEGGRMEVTPMAAKPVVLRRSGGSVMPAPVVVINRAWPRDLSVASDLDNLLRARLCLPRTDARPPAHPRRDHRTAPRREGSQART